MLKRTLIRRLHIFPAVPLSSKEAPMGEYKPPSFNNRAYKCAMDYLAMEQAKIEAEIVQLEKSDAGNDVIQAKKIELGYSKVQNHFEFQAFKADIRDPLFEDMYKKRYNAFVVPKLIAETEKHGLVADVFGDQVNPTTCLQVNFDQYAWLGAYGHGVEPTRALVSPKVEVLTGHDEERLYSLVMLDADRANPLLKQVNIPIGKHLVIPAGSSPLLDGVDQSKAPKLPGEVIFDYVPPHPPHRNPKMSHRYVIVLMEQKEKIIVDEFKDQINKRAADVVRMAKENNGVSVIYGKGEEKLQVWERSSALPLLKMASEQQMKVTGYGFFRCSYDLTVPDIFTRLGIHEPVYATLPRGNPSRFVNRLATAQQVFKENITDVSSEGIIKALNEEREVKYPIPLAREKFSRHRLSDNLYDCLNRGEEAPVSKEGLHKLRMDALDRVSTILEKKERQQEKALEKKAEKSKVTLKQLKQEMEDSRLRWRSTKGKIPSITSIAATALVKNKPGEPSAQIRGKLSKQVLEKPFPFANM